MTNELLVCPFCGGEFKIHEDTADAVGEAMVANGGFYVGHGAAHAKGCRVSFGGYFPSEQAAIESCNTRQVTKTPQNVSSDDLSNTDVTAALEWFDIYILAAYGIPKDIGHSNTIRKALEAYKG